MKRIPSLLVAFALFATPTFAQKKSCEDLKTEIAAKLDAKGVKNYSLNVVTAQDVKDEKVVGSCEAGTKRITYKRN